MESTMEFTSKTLSLCIDVIKKLNTDDIEKVVSIICQVRDNGGRIFFIGSGGGAGHASHAVCDFRKLCNVEAYAPYDNVSELTARVNDEGWDISLVNWLTVSRFNKNDALFVFSVGGGNQEEKISMNLVNAIKHARATGAKIAGVVGKDGGFTRTVGDAVVVVPTVDAQLVTPLTEGFQSLLWHLLVSHPKLQVHAAKWESLT
jgi:D-sedoheptulose 7-phosphate isomerase